MNVLLQLFFCVLVFRIDCLDQSVDFGVAFPSGETLQESQDNPGKDYDDPQLTGSYLFEVEGESVTGGKRLGLNIRVQEWKAAQNKFFRAHPVFIKCLQDAWTELQNNDQEPQLKSGYKSAKEVSATSKKAQDIYARAGTGATLAAKDLKALVTSLLRHCPVPFSEMGRDLGLVMMADSVFVYLTGTQTASRQSFTVEGSSLFATSQDFKQWCQSTLDSVFDPVSVPACTKGKGLAPNGLYPAGATSAESVVGKIDRVVNRGDGPDFIRLLQYPANSIVFQDSESQSSWCGVPGIRCPACANGIVGNAASTRCADRTMSPRMFKLIRVLQKLARGDAATGNSKLKILEAWDENHSAKPQGDTPTNSLHREGRQVTLQLATGSSTATLTALSRLAICVGFDYVKHAGDQLVLAVIKQAKLKTEAVQFIGARVMPVAIPSMEINNYRIFPGDDDEMTTYPFFDSEIGSRLMASEGAPLSLFRAKEAEFRYMRLHPRIAECFSSISIHENRMKKSGEKKLQFKVVRAYMSRLEEKSLFDPVMDERISTHTLGIALHLNYDVTGEAYSKSEHTLWRLAETVTAVCAPIFYQEGHMTGVGIYRDGVYVDMRDKYLAWFECPDNNCPSLKPPGRNQDKYLEEIEERVVQAIRGRMISPLNVESACKFDDPPAPQSPTFVHQHTESTKRVRRAAANDPNACVPQTNTYFCSISSKARKQAVDELWADIRRKYIVVGEPKLEEALRGCLGVCGTCTEGDLWHSKVENCNNLVHWMPFETLNNLTNVVTNLYPRGDAEARRLACYTRGRHCVDLSPLFSILFPTMDKKFRIEEGKAAKGELFNEGENPIPLLKQINRLYAINARGEVHLWLRREDDINSMEDALKVVFLYNKNVTSVKIFVLEDIAKSSIISVLESYLQQWATTGCPITSRTFLTSYTIESFNHSMRVKRSAEIHIRDQILEESRRWETDGLFSEFI